MVNMKPLNRIARTIILVTFLVVLQPVSLGAESGSAAQGAQVSPAKVELNASKGKSYAIDLKVMNITNSNLYYSMSVADFTASNESGSPKIEENSNLPSTASVRTWVAGLKDFSLGTKQEQQIRLYVNVPDDAEAGGHYGVIQFSGVSPEVDTTGVGLSASTGVLLLVRVDGSISEQASLSSFFVANKEGGNQSSFFESTPLTFVFRAQNTGNVHIKPTGNIEVRDMFGNLYANISVNKDASNVLPKSVRRFESTLKDGWMFGLYSANLVVGYGTQGQTIMSSINFWVIPYKIVGLAMVLAIVVIFILSRMLRMYNKRIERRVLQQHENKKNNKQGKA